MFKKAFWVPYEDSANYPTLAKTMEAISKYCEENGKSYTFINDDEVEINGKRYEIYRSSASHNPASENSSVPYFCGSLSRFLSSAVSSFLTSCMHWS